MTTKMKRKVKKRARARCRICGFSCRLRRDGAAMKHTIYTGHSGRTCPGSGTKFMADKSLDRGQALKLLRGDKDNLTILDLRRRLDGLRRLELGE